VGNHSHVYSDQKLLQYKAVCAGALSWWINQSWFHHCSGCSCQAVTSDLM